MTLQINPEALPAAPSEAAQEIGALLSFARGLVVNNEGAFATITEVYAKARAMERLVNARLKEANQPYQAQMNANQDAARSFLGPIKEIIGVCNSQTSQYRAQLVESKRQEEEKTRAAASAFNAPMPYIAPIERIRGSGATSVVKKRIRVALEDISKVPLRYLILNEEAVLADVKLGVGSISGLKIWEEQTSELRTR